MKGREIREITRESAPNNGIVRHDSVTRPGIEPGSPWWEASVLIAQPPRPQELKYCGGQGQQSINSAMGLRAGSCRMYEWLSFSDRRRAARAVTSEREVCDCEYQAVKSAVGRLDYWSRCPMRVIAVSVEQRRNEATGETGDPRENPPADGTVRHDSHMRKSGLTRARGSNPDRLGLRAQLRIMDDGLVIASIHWPTFRGSDKYKTRPVAPGTWT
ncbi:hypothetical protein PR048_033552 [Dryococelus australis]|uniref:Uncharacterized protein n=1 Tax=Dryococelus australis TaxID=614101 RepID=A0ABQ9G1I1_9NEOP|nr:hypothetical protein PR048_033552 [Dryococelus australis]